MPTFDSVLDGFVTGDHLEVRRTIIFAASGLPTGTTITNAWLTVKQKAGDPDPGLVQKAITTTDSPGTGQIENDGTGDTDFILRFDLLPADTVAIGTADKVFDVQVKTAGGKIFTPESGIARASAAEVTEAS